MRPIIRSWLSRARRGRSKVRASYLPSIEKKYGRSIAEWQQIIRDSGIEKHMQIVEYLKTEYGMGHGHANALVGWTLAGDVARA